MTTNHHVSQPTDNASDQEKEVATRGYDFNPVALDRPLCQASSDFDKQKIQAAISIQITRQQEQFARRQRT